MKFKYVFFAALIFSFHYSQIFLQNKKSGLIGKWESLVVTRNNTVKVIEFLPHGKFVFRSELVADYKYKVEENKLITSLKNKYSHKLVVDTSTIVIKPNVIIRTNYSNGKKQVYKLIRVGERKTTDKGVLGKWKWKYPMGGYATAEFTAAGHMLFKTNVNTFKGKYSEKGKHVTIDFDKGIAKKQNLVIWQKENLLIITYPGKKSRELYRRVK